MSSRCIRIYSESIPSLHTYWVDKWKAVVEKCTFNLEVGIDRMLMATDRVPFQFPENRNRETIETKFAIARLLLLLYCSNAGIIPTSVSTVGTCWKICILLDYLELCQASDDRWVGRSQSNRSPAPASRCDFVSGQIWWQWHCRSTAPLTYHPAPSYRGGELFFRLS